MISLFYLKLTHFQFREMAKFYVLDALKVALTLNAFTVYRKVAALR